MNSLLRASALTVAGVAGIVLYAQHSVRLEGARDMQQAELHCHFARYYAEMDSRWRDTPAKIQQSASDVNAACDDFHKMRAIAKARQTTRDRPTDNLLRTMGPIMAK